MQERARLWVSTIPKERANQVASTKCMVRANCRESTRGQGASHQEVSTICQGEPKIERVPAEMERAKALTASL